MSLLVALLVLVNPVAAAPAFLALARRMAPIQRVRTAAGAALCVAAVIAGTAWLGTRRLAAPAAGLCFPHRRCGLCGFRRR